MERAQTELTRLVDCFPIHCEINSMPEKKQNSKQSHDILMEFLPCAQWSTVDASVSEKQIATVDYHLSYTEIDLFLLLGYLIFLLSPGI